MKQSALFSCFFAACLLFTCIQCKDEDTNKGFEGAIEISDGQTVDGDIKNDINNFRYYSFTFDKAGLLKLKVDDAQGKFRFVVYNTSDEASEIARSEFIEIGSTFNKIYGPLSAGTHYLAVSATTDTFKVKYSFKAFFDFSDVSEMNNTFSNATFMPTNQAFQGKILAINDGNNFEDVDVLKFNIQTKPRVVKVKFSAPASIIPYTNSIRFGVYNAANELSLLEYKEVKQGQTDSIWVGPLDVGEHYIVVNNGGICDCQSEESYKIQVEVDNRDSNEPNDKPFENATIIANLDDYHTGTLFYPNGDGNPDVDWYKYVPPGTGNGYQIEIIGLPSSIYTQAQIFTHTPDEHPDFVINVNNSLLGSQGNINFFADVPCWIKVQMSNPGEESNGTYMLRIIKP